MFNFVSKYCGCLWISLPHPHSKIKEEKYSLLERRYVFDKYHTQIRVKLLTLDTNRDIYNCFLLTKI